MIISTGGNSIYDLNIVKRQVLDNQNKLLLIALLASISRPIIGHREGAVTQVFIVRAIGRFQDTLLQARRLRTP